jgi:hypothetical protein
MTQTRTSVVLDPDVAEQLKALARQRNFSIMAALNSVIRAGLDAKRGGAGHFQVSARPMGLKPGIDLTHALQLAVDLEDEEIIQKLDQQK